ncbi:MAG: hypothetical protein ACI85F_001939 [Bacteroidia bacterium]|jgi:uncharacterized protein YqgV (UPF0045/DUF77 family)
MKVSLEISMYPLTEDYKPVVNDFLRRLNSHGLKTVTNGMSTQVFGEYDEVMSALNTSLKPSFEDETKVSVSIKILNGHLPPDKWDPKAWS